MNNPILYLLLNGFAVLIFFLISAIIHEIGHALFIKIYTKKFPVLKSSKSLFFSIGNFYYNCDALNDDEYLTTLWAGVVAGGLPVFILGLNLHPFFFLILLFTYLYGCKSDIKNIRGLIK